MRARTGSAAVWYIFKYDVFVWQHDVFVWQWFHNQERGVREKFFLIKQILIAAVDGKTVFVSTYSTVFALSRAIMPQD